MTADNSEEAEWSIDRRTILRSAVGVSVAGFVGFPALSAGAVAQPAETLYLTDSGESDDQISGTILYDVTLDETDAVADLTQLHNLPGPAFDRVDAIAATPDGATIYAIDRNTGHLGEYDVSGDSFADLGILEVDGTAYGDMDLEVVLAAFAPSGTFYMAAQRGDGLYTVDPTASPPTANRIATIDVDVQGADIAFDASGTLYLYSSDSEKLYTVDTASGTASEVGTSQSQKGSFTGLAVRANGTGDIVGSRTTSGGDESVNEIVVFDKTTGAEGQAFEMELGGEDYDYGFGDMSVGPLVQACVPCESGTDLLVKYEWDEQFAIEGPADQYIELTDVSVDEDGEPIEACFSTTYCGLDAVVKAGSEYETYEDVSGEICVTGIEAENPGGKTVTYAISNVRFYCEVPEDVSVGNSGKQNRSSNSNGNGRGKGRGN